MGSFIIDSIGFSASHAMAEILRSQPNFCVTHGSKNFKEGGMIGVNNLSVTEFVSQMLEVEKTHDHCVAVHCIFDPAATLHEAKKQRYLLRAMQEKYQKAGIELLLLGGKKIS